MDSNSIKITLPDGSVREYPKGISAAEVVRSIGSGLAKASLAATIDGKPVDLGTAIDHDAAFTALTFDSPEGRDIYRHSASHLMAQAVTELYPGVKVAIGPSIEDGFYYDFDRDTPFAPEDLARIEAQMAEIVKRDLPITRQELSRAEAL